MKYRVPRCLYSRAEGCSWIALVRSFTASLIRPRGDRIYKPKHVIRGEIFQESTPKLPMFSTFQCHLATLHSQSYFPGSKNPWPHLLHSEVQSHQAEGPLPGLCTAEGEADELELQQLLCPGFIFRVTTGVALLEMGPIFSSTYLYLSKQNLAFQS